jgi:hypothetical protein
MRCDHHKNGGLSENRCELTEAQSPTRPSGTEHVKCRTRPFGYYRALCLWRFYLRVTLFVLALVTSSAGSGSNRDNS